MIGAFQNSFHFKRADVKEAVQVEKWIFMLIIAVLGYMCSRELSRLSSSIEALARTQTDQMQLYQDLKLELRSFEIEVRSSVKKP